MSLDNPQKLMEEIRKSPESSTRALTEMRHIMEQMVFHMEEPCILCANQKKLSPSETAELEELLSRGDREGLTDRQKLLVDCAKPDCSFRFCEYLLTGGFPHINLGETCSLDLNNLREKYSELCTFWEGKDIQSITLDGRTYEVRGAGEALVKLVTWVKSHTTQWARFTNDFHELRFGYQVECNAYFKIIFVADLETTMNVKFEVGRAVLLMSDILRYLGIGPGRISVEFIQETEPYGALVGD